MIELRLLVLCLAYMSHTVRALSGEQIAEDMRASLSAGSGVYLSSDHKYSEETTPRWDVYDAPLYTVAVKPVLTRDIQIIVEYARKNQVPFLATGGGHGSSSTLAGLQEGLKVELGNFDAVQINSTTNKMIIGGSVRSAEVAAALQVAGNEIPVAQCDCVGFTGATLGGGIGPYSGLYGAMSDSVSSIEMITGRGDILTVSADDYSDLFWGMKGAGFNYGIVTSLTYEVYDATNDGLAMNADMIFAGSQNGSVWALAQSFVGKQPKELTVTFSIEYDVGTGEIVVKGGFIYAGSPGDGKRLIQPFLDLQPTNVNISTVRWQDIPRATLFGATTQGCIPGINYVPHSVNLYEVNVESLTNVVNFMRDSMSVTPQVQSAVVALSQYAPFGFQEHADASSAYPYRDVVMYAQVDGFALNTSDVPVLSEWGQEMRDRLQRGSGKDDLEVYVHFANGDEGQKAWYTESKLSKLQKLKAKYDPDSLFSFYNPVHID